MNKVRIVCLVQIAYIRLYNVWNSSYLNLSLQWVEGACGVPIGVPNMLRDLPDAGHMKHGNRKPIRTVPLVREVYGALTPPTTMRDIDTNHKREWWVG